MGVGASGGGGGTLTYEAVRVISPAATAFLVWLARLLSRIGALHELWHSATAACKKAELQIDAARNEVPRRRGWPNFLICLL